MPRAFVTFREEQIEIDIINYSVDHSVNVTELEWSIVGLTDAGRSLLKMSSLEEDMIEEQLIEFMEGYHRHDDDYYRDE